MASVDIFNINYHSCDAQIDIHIVSFWGRKTESEITLFIPGKFLRIFTQKTLDKSLCLYDNIGSITLCTLSEHAG